MVCLKLHAVHWNEDLYSCYEDAAKSNEGILILAVFLKVCVDNLSTAQGKVIGIASIRPSVCLSDHFHSII